MDAENPVLTCFAPAIDLPCMDGQPSKNLWGSVGSDPRLGGMREAWRRSAMEGFHDSPRASDAAPAASGFDSDIQRLLDGDSDDEGPPVGALTCSAPAPLSLLPKQDGKEAEMCTTCWNVGAAMAQKQDDNSFSLPTSAMALGSSKMMSKEERTFVHTLISGGDAEAPRSDQDEFAAAAEFLASLESPKSSTVQGSDASSVFSSEGDTEASAVLVSTVSDIPYTHPMKRSSGSDEADEMPKRPRRAAAARASALAVRALATETDASDSEAGSSAAHGSSKGVGGRHGLQGDDDEDDEDHHQHDATDDEDEDEDEDEDDDDGAAYVPVSSSSSSHASISHSSRSRGGGSGGSRGRQLSESAVTILKEWLLSPEHFDFPWPAPEEKTELAKSAGIDERQLGIWLTNARKRLWMPLRKRRGLPIIKYAEAKAERQQRALVARVEAAHAAREHQPKAASSCLSLSSPSLSSSSLPPSLSSPPLASSSFHSAPSSSSSSSSSSASSSSSTPSSPAASSQVAEVNAVGLARIRAALRAQEANLQMEEDSLARAANQLQARLVALSTITAAPVQAPVSSELSHALSPSPSLMFPDMEDDWSIDEGPSMMGLL